MNDSVNIVQFVRVGGIPWALLVITASWFLASVLGRSAQRLGERFSERRLLLQQSATVLRFLVSFMGIIGAALLVFRLSEQMLLALGGTLAVAIGIAMKDLAASILAGLMILFDRPFQVGDRVTFGGFYGDVSHIGLRSVRLVTLDDSMVTIPNNKFLTDIVSSGNAGALDMLVQMDFFVGSDQDLPTAKRVVRDALTATRYAYLQKPWAVLVSQLVHQGYFAVRLRAKVYVLDVKYEKALESDVTERVLAGFRDEGIAPPAVLHRGVDGDAPPMLGRGAA